MTILFVVLFVALDVILGFLAAVRAHDVQSSKMRDGLLRKCANIFVPILGLLLDMTGHYLQLGLPVNLMSIAAGYVIMMEAISILENLHKINEHLVPDIIGKLLGIVVDK